MATIGRSWRPFAGSNVKCSGDGRQACLEDGVHQCVAGHARGQCRNLMCLAHIYICGTCQGTPLCVRHSPHSSHGKLSGPRSRVAWEKFGCSTSVGREAAVAVETGLVDADLAEGVAPVMGYPLHREGILPR